LASETAPALRGPHRKMQQHSRKIRRTGPRLLCGGARKMTGVSKTTSIRNSIN
jgi:hypothetical protein